MIEMNFLGSPQIFVDGQVVTPSVGRKEIALLAYLSVQRAGVLREKLADLLWSELVEGGARQNLRQALYSLNSKLPGVIEARRRSAFIALSPNALGGTDIYQMEGLLQAESFEAACALYRGTFLEGLALNRAAAFEEWLSEQQHTYERLALEALEQALALATQRHDDRAQQLYARRIIALDPLREEAYQQLMLALARVGGFNEAMQVYEQCIQTLRRELNVSPMPETTAVYEGVLLARARSRPSHL